MKNLPHFSPTFEIWAPVIARIIFGGTFLMSAFFKIPGTESFAMQVEMSAGVGIPFAYVAVILAFVLEIVAGVAVIVGWQTRTAAFALAIFVLLIALFFYRNLADQTQFASFMSCLVNIAGLLYVAVYGSQHVAVAKDSVPK